MNNKYSITMSSASSTAPPPKVDDVDEQDPDRSAGALPDDSPDGEDVLSGDEVDRSFSNAEREGTHEADEDEGSEIDESEDEG